MKSKGFSVTALKIDPYINWDAGTMRPIEHGEVWVTEDDGEIDQDLGHYDRFLDITLSKAHNITTGQVYYAVIERERAGKYLGKTVNSTEINETTKHPVVDFLPWQKKLIAESKYGATMRLGGQMITIKPNTLAHRLYGKCAVLERFRHRYEINPKYINILEKDGFIFSGESEKDEGIMQIGELPPEKHKFFIGTQAHPEFTSRPLRPNPLFDGFIQACVR